MAKAPAYSTSAINASVDGIVDLVDGGTTNSEGRLLIYEGTKPADPDTAPSGGTLLATINLDAPPAFGDAAAGVAAANGVPKQANAVADGTAQWFRITDRDNNGIMDGTCGTSDADLIMDSVSILTGNLLQLNSFTVTQSKT